MGTLYMGEHLPDPMRDHVWYLEQELLARLLDGIPRRTRLEKLEEAKRRSDAEMRGRAQSPGPAAPSDAGDNDQAVEPEDDYDDEADDGAVT